MKINNKKGFTLIELMIVIAIIGILAVTVVPRLTWAQAKARDTWRLANVKNVTAALASYFWDFSSYPNWSEFPWESENNGCLSAKDGAMRWKLADYFEWKKAPLDPIAWNKSTPCEVEWSLWYKVLSHNADNAAYLITTDVEQDVAANTILTDNTKTSYTDYENIVWKKDKKTTHNDAKQAVYAEIHY